MRKLWIALALGIAIVLGALLFVVANLNAWLASNRDRVEGLASETVGREVRFDRAEVAFSSGLAVRLVGLRVAEDPRFGGEDFLALEEAYVGVRLWPALQRRVEVSRVRLVAPTIRAIQTVEGFNFASLAPREEASNEVRSENVEAASFAVAIAVLEIADGTIHYADRTSADGLALVIESLETSGTDLALEGPIELDFAGNLRSSKDVDAGLESRVEGRVALANLSPLSGGVTLTSPRLHPALLGVRLRGAGGAEHVDALTIEVTLSPDPEATGHSVSLRSSEALLAGFDLEDLAADVRYRPTPAGAAVALEGLTLAIAGGRFDVSGDALIGEPDASRFALEMKLRALDADELAGDLLSIPDDAVSGRIEGDLSLAGRSLEWASLQRSLAGQGRLAVGAGALEQVNVLKTLVARLSADPGLGALAAEAIRDVMPEALQGDRTPFEGVDLRLEVAKGAVQARNFSISAGDFGIRATGQVGLDGVLAADGTIRFSDRVSERIFDKVDQLAPLLEEEGVVALPLKIGGTLGAPRLAPDLAVLADKAQKAFNVRLSRGIVDSLFGPRGEEAGSTKEEEGGKRKSDRDAAEALIEKGLDRLFGR
jgi:hypothetical protein